MDRSLPMAVLEPLDAVDEQDDLNTSLSSSLRAETVQVDWRTLEEPDDVLGLDSPVHRADPVLDLSIMSLSISSLAAQVDAPKARQDSMAQCYHQKNHKAVHLSLVKGVIFRGREARENGLLAALIKIGQLDQARAKMKWMTSKDMIVTSENQDMMNNATGEHDWRSPWTPFKRPLNRMETRRALVKELKDGNAQMDKVRAEGQKAAEFQAKWKADQETLRKQMKDFTMWQIYLIVPWKDAKVVLDVDSDFTLWRVKKMIHESEGVSVEQQKLWVIRRVPQKPRKSAAAVAAEQAAAARTERLLRTSALGMICQAGLAGKNERSTKKTKTENNNFAGFLRTSSSFQAFNAETQSPGGLAARFHSPLKSAQSPLAASRERDTPSPFTQNNPFHQRHGARWGNTPKGSPMRSIANRTKWDTLDHIKSTKKQWAALARSHASPKIIAPKLGRQTSLKRVAVSPVDYQNAANVKVELVGDDRLLTSLEIQAGDTLQVGIDEHATKLKQRQALLKELGELTGDDREQRVISAFHRFDIDNSGTIEARELGLSMMSLGIYLTDHELNALTRQFDENGDGEFDLPEFHDMIVQIIEGGLDEFGQTKY